MNIGDYKGAIKDFDKILELEPKEILNNFRDYLNEIIRYKIRAIDIPLGISYIYPVP